MSPDEKDRLHLNGVDRGVESFGLLSVTGDHATGSRAAVQQALGNVPSGHRVVDGVISLT